MSIKAEIEGNKHSYIRGAAYFIFSYAPAKNIVRWANYLYIGTSALWFGNLTMTRIDNV